MNQWQAGQDFTQDSSCGQVLMKQDGPAGIEPKQQLEAEQVTVNQDQQVQQNFTQKLRVGTAQHSQDRPPLSRSSPLVRAFLTLLLLGAVLPAVYGSHMPGNNYRPELRVCPHLQGNLPPRILVSYRDMLGYLMKLTRRIGIPRAIRHPEHRLMLLRHFLVDRLPQLTIATPFTVHHTYTIFDRNIYWPLNISIQSPDYLIGIIYHIVHMVKAW